MIQLRLGDEFTAARDPHPRTSPSPASDRLRKATSRGVAQSEQATERAERERIGFRDQARRFFLWYLGAHGPTSSENLTDAAAEAGIIAQDRRAFGAVYRELQRAGLIVVTGACLREYGHGATGGKVWGLK